MKKAIIIVGPPCSGKTTICNKLSKDLGIKLVNENNSGNLFGILNNLHIQRETLIIEHSDILNYLEEIKSVFDKLVIIYLDVSDDLLLSNCEERIKNNSVGDFKNVDILKIKKDIDKSINKINSKMIFKIKIKNKSDYDNKYELIKELAIL